MVKRIAVVFPDGSINVVSGAKSEAQALHEARREKEVWNKGERDKSKHAMIDLNSFRERF